jgi:hypothetical protein
MHYVIRTGNKQLKSYKGRVGGHFILMLNGFLTVFINWILLVVVLIYFTPAIFPAVDPTLAVESQSDYVFYYFVVILHLVATSVLGASILLRSLICPYTMTEKALL